MEQELRTLLAHQARTNALLEALTHEVREGFTRGRERFDEHHTRLENLEHDRTRLKTGLRVSFGLGSIVASATFISLYTRIAEWLR